MIDWNARYDEPRRGRGVRRHDTVLHGEKTDTRRTKSKHSPLPWKFGNYGSDIVDANGNMVVCCWQSQIAEDNFANAELVLRAVNCHDELVEACKRLLAVCEKWHLDDPVCNDGWNAARLRRMAIEAQERIEALTIQRSNQQ